MKWIYGIWENPNIFKYKFNFNISLRTIRAIKDLLWTKKHSIHIVDERGGRVLQTINNFVQ